MDDRLFFNKEGKFKILQFTDLHYEEGKEKDKKTLLMMEEMIKWEKPDFIMITGDAVTGLDTKQNVEKIMKPIVDAKILFSFVFGNHDDEEGATKEVLFQEIKKLSGCLMVDETEAGYGIGNHILTIKNQAGKVKWILTGIDSGTYCNLEGLKGYDYIHQCQIQWYLNRLKEIEKESDEFSSLLFFHIPIPEYQTVWDGGKCIGEKLEYVEDSEVNSGLFAATVTDGHTKGMFVGHDHINDYSGNLAGIQLAYGRVSGFEGYQDSDYKRGARIIILDEANTKGFETYIRLEDKSIIGREVTE